MTLRDVLLVCCVCAGMPTAPDQPALPSYNLLSEEERIKLLEGCFIFSLIW